MPMAAWPSIAFGIEKNFCAVVKLAQFFYYLAKPAQIRIVERETLLGDHSRLIKMLG